jgi:hypothetical protein
MRLLRRIARAKRCGRLDVIVCVAGSAHESDRAACGACDVMRVLAVAELQRLVEVDGRSVVASTPGTLCHSSS